MRTGFANPPEDQKTRIATNYLQLTPPRYIYVYDLEMVRDSTDPQQIQMVHRAADRKALLHALRPNVPELNNHQDWVSDGDLLWSTSDLFNSFTPNAAPPRDSLMVMTQHDLTRAADLRYYNECGVRLEIERIDIHFLERIDTQQPMRHLMDVPAGMPLRRSTPGLLLRGLNAMLTLNARNNDANLTPKGGNKFFDHGRVHTLHDQARSLRGFFLSARPGLDRLLLNISPACSPFWDVITVHDFIIANPVNNARLLALLKGLKVRIRYAPRTPFSRPSEGFRFINDLVGDIANTICQDPGVGNQQFTVQRWYGNAQHVAQQQRNHPLYPTNTAENRAMVTQISNRPWECAVKVARNSQSNPANFEYFPASMLEIIEFQPRHGDLTTRQVSEMIKQAQSEPADHANSIINNGLPMFGLLGQGQSGLRAFGNMSTGTQLISVPGVFLDAPEVKYGLPPGAGGNKPDTALVRGAAWRLVNGGGQPYPFKGARMLQGLSAVATTGAGFPTEGLDVIRRALQNHGILARGAQAPQWNNCSSVMINGATQQINGSTSAQHNAHANTPAQETNIYDVLSQVRINSPCAVIIPEKDYDLYAYLKRVADLRVGLHTVMMDSSKMGDPWSQQFPQVASNIALKFNLKAGGTNHVLGDTSFPGLRRGQNCDVIVIGADVTHPGVGSREGTPSIAAVVGSTDNQFMHFPGSMRLQRSRKEEIVELGDMVKERLIDWAMKHRNNQGRPTLPARMLFYRDGVSESQYAKMRSFEIPQIQKAFNWAQAYLEWRQAPRPAGVSLDPASNPWPAVIPSTQHSRENDEEHFVDNTQFNASPVPFQLTYVIVGKRHNTRFYPMRVEDITKIGTKIANRNVRPGLVVDQVITHPYSFDFYLQSHQAVKGTARSAHYFVLQNGMGLTHDQLQRTTHDFCYAYARATKGVSYCAPAYYADRLCDRGRCYLRHWLKCRRGQLYGYTRTRNVGEHPKTYNNIVKNWLRDQPYWRPYALAPQGQPGALHRPQKYGFDRRNPWHPNLDDVMFYL